MAVGNVVSAATPAGMACVLGVLCSAAWALLALGAAAACAAAIAGRSGRSPRALGGGQGAQGVRPQYVGREGDPLGWVVRQQCRQRRGTAALGGGVVYVPVTGEGLGVSVCWGKRFKLAAFRGQGGWVRCHSAARAGRPRVTDGRMDTLCGVGMFVVGSCGSLGWGGGASSAARGCRGRMCVCVSGWGGGRLPGFGLLAVCVCV